jgi:hypothetical protein
MGPQFFETYMGRKFFEADFPRLIQALESISIQNKTQELTELSVSVFPQHLIKAIPSSDERYPGIFIEIAGIQVALVEFDKEKNRYQIHTWRPTQNQEGPTYSVFYDQKQFECNEK